MTENEPQDISAFDIEIVETGQKVIYPDIKSTVVLFFVFILTNFIVAIPAIILVIGLNGLYLNTPLLKSSLNLLLYVATLLITIWSAIKRSKKQQGYFLRISFSKIPAWLVPVVIIGTLAMVIPLEQTSAWIPMPNSIQKLFQSTFTKDIISIINVAIAAPVLEEILCRGIVLRGLLKNYSPYTAVLVSAIFFGAIHLNPWQAIPAFLGGLFLGWIYYKTQSVVPGIFIHATINVTATLFLFLPHNQQGFLGLLGTHYYLGALVVSILVFTAVCFIIQKKVSIIPNPVD